MEKNLQQVSSNQNLRKNIVSMITRAGEGHIPSSFSIVDIISELYKNFLKVDPKNPDSPDRDYFVLSKGHGCAALYAVLENQGFIKQTDVENYGKFDAMLGGHPDRIKIPGVEASTGSLGHGACYAMGIALGLKIQKKPNRVVALMGDGECHEGTIWEMALVAQNLKLSNFTCIIDFNGSAAQILPHPNIVAQWKSFGWEVFEMDGHDQVSLNKTIDAAMNSKSESPRIIIAKTVKGKGIKFMETHGIWHHKIPNETEYKSIMQELDT